MAEWKNFNQERLQIQFPLDRGSAVSGPLSFELSNVDVAPLNSILRSPQ